MNHAYANFAKRTVMIICQTIRITVPIELILRTAWGGGGLVNDFQRISPKRR